MTDTSLPAHETDDYGRPLVVNRQPGEVRALFRGHLLASTDAAFVARERGEDARYYFPESAVEMSVLRPNGRTSRDPAKGELVWFTLYRDREIIEDAAWSFPAPLSGAEALAGLIGFNPTHIEIEIDAAQAPVESPVINDYIRHTDSGAGVSQAERWDATVERPGEGV